MRNPLKIAPSILPADFSRLGDEIRRLERAGADMIHIDVMDGDFVPNISVGPLVIKSIRGCTRLPFDVHLMISRPDRYLASFAEAGADILTVHAEACAHLHRTVQSIRALGLTAAVALNPHSPLSCLDWILEDVGMVLLMSVNPGFGGQTFIAGALEKIRALRARLPETGSAPDIQVDGGIGPDNIGAVVAAGANVIVAGSAVFRAPDMAAAMEQLRGRAARPEGGLV
jgi:ribulose-phosphate 3-epimerase